ncbi:glycosyltransferase family 2 protein [Enterobacter ludwigii]|uniref:glycosyltransferase family 2 protein n=1 Tax=Enterobacter ludwigii TaxID=299767 RepID=UPI003524E67B
MQNNKLPKVSVLVPCFNHEKYISQCLESLTLAYSGTLDVIICDDASTDQSVNIIDDFISKNTSESLSFTFIKRIKNKGISASLNSCMERSTSDYIYIIASDDFLIPNGLTCAIEKILNENADAVISDCRVVDDEGQIVSDSAFFSFRTSSPDRLIKNIANELVFNWNVPGPSLVLKKDVYKKIGLYNEELMAEDRDFYLRLNSKTNVIFNFDVIANYRVHNSNLSRKKEYLVKKDKEFALVNYKWAKLYSGVPALYLKSYKLDILGFRFLPRVLRKLLRIIYISIY